MIKTSKLCAFRYVKALQVKLNNSDELSFSATPL